MLVDDLRKYLSNANQTSIFSTELGENGGYLNFANSGQRGGVKVFTLSLNSLLQVLINIKDNLDEFIVHSTYVEKEWRDLGSAYYTDGPANALSTVQTKPLFVTLSKFINWANGRTTPDDSTIALSIADIDRSVEKLKELIVEFTPVKGFSGLTSSVELLKPQMVRDYTNSLEVISLRIAPLFPVAQIAALLCKNFLIFTGLSGSGKTMLAQAFSQWISTKKALENPFVVGVKVEAAQSVYTIVDSDRLGVEISQSGSGTNVFIPFDLIEEWVKVINENNFNIATPSSDIKDKVMKEGSKYSGTLNSFHSPLKALAFYSLENRVAIDVGCQYELIAVGADWTSNENLLGYPDALSPKSYRKPDNGALDLILEAHKNPQLPFFLILDEMNLSHVERYFADFLSAMESGEAINLHAGDENELWNGIPGKLKIPPNLFVIGTVNVDETTYMFSPKVLDRANVIEFRVSEDEMLAFLENPIKPDMELISGLGAQYGKAFVSSSKQKNVALDNYLQRLVSGELMKFFPELQKTGAEFGYRAAHEIWRFIYFHKELSDDSTWSINSAMDAAIMQKLLPKLHGSKKKLGPVLAALIHLCLKHELRSETGPAKDEMLIEENAIYPRSLEKLARMRKRLGEHGFTSFVEA